MGWGRRRALPFALQGHTCSLFEALASSHIVLLVLLPLFALKVAFTGAIRIFARLGELLLAVLALRQSVALPNALEVLQMAQELALFEWAFVRAGWIFTKSWIERLVSLA